jgi:TRAP-type mannitol/chloroaromatic compound transport system substrate-binding protein
MKRRSFIKRVGAVGVATGALLSGAPAVHAQKKYQWKMVTTWPKNFPGLGTGANYLADIIGKMSDGRMEVKVFGAGELVPAFGSFDAVSQGTAEMGHGAAYYWKGKTEASQFFAAVPYGLNSSEMAGWIHYGGGQKLWDDLYADFNLKPFAVGNTGVQMGGWFNKEINSVDDYKGLKMRMPGLGGEVIKRAGATPVSLPGGEIFQALQSGAIDATEWVGPYNDLAFGFYKAATYYYWPGWHEPGTVLESFVNKKAYEDLPSDLQVTIEQAAKAAYNDMFAEFTARNNAALVELVKKHKVKLRRFPDEVLKKMGELSVEVVSEVAKQDPKSKAVFASFNDFRQQAFSWDRIGEAGFSVARSLSFKA